MILWKYLARAFIAFLTAVLALTSMPASAKDDYPSKHINMLFGWGPGGFESSIRLLSDLMSQKLGQPIVFMSKPGGSGVIAARQLFSAKPDGYTIGQMDTSTYLLKPHTMSVPFDPVRDTQDICGVYKYVHGYAVKADSPWKTHQDVIEWSKKNPGKFRYAVSGSGTAQHLAMKWISTKENVEWIEVPYKSGGEGALAVLGGHVEAVASGAMDIVNLARAGELRLILGLNDNRWEDFPDVPNMAELGYGFYAQTYISLSAPQGLPDSVASILEAACKEAVQDPSFIRLAQENYFLVSYMSGKEFTSMWHSLIDNSKDAVIAAGLEKK